MQQGTYYGSVSWGWTCDATGKLTKLPLTATSQGVPSQSFLAAAAQWNTATGGGTLKARKAQTQVYRDKDGKIKPVFTIAKDTVVISKANIGVDAVEYVLVTIQGKPHANEEGLVRATDLADQGDGPQTVDLPTPQVETITAAQQLNDGVSGPWRCTQSLRAGSRVVRTGRTPGLPPAGKVHVRVVDGPDTDAEGYVDGAALDSERP